MIMETDTSISSAMLLKNAKEKNSVSKHEIWLRPRSHYVRRKNLTTQLYFFHQENGAFRKRYSNPNRRNLKTSALRFSVDEKHFESGAFRKR